MLSVSTIPSSFRLGLRSLLLSIGIVSSLAWPSQANHLLPLQLAAKPFSSTMCKRTTKETYIQIAVAKHQDIVIKKVPGQHIPQNSDQARKKDYVHYVTLPDLTDGLVTTGAIAFDHRHGIIFQMPALQKISRKGFITHLPDSQRVIAEKALNTFLHLHPIFNAAIAGCRPLPPHASYETDDETLRIETGKRLFTELVQEYNRNPLTSMANNHHESGKSEGFIDPEAGKGSNISYQAMNPLNFYVPTSYP